MSDIEMHYRFERYWEENASKDTWANKSVAFNIWQSRQAEIDALQKRIDEALHAADESCGVSVAAFVKLNKILKGNQDEN